MMKNKTLRAILLTLGLMLTAFAVLLIGSAPASVSVITSNPAAANHNTVDASTLETISDETVPLAAPQAADPQLIVTTVAVRGRVAGAVTVPAIDTTVTQASATPTPVVPTPTPVVPTATPVEATATPVAPTTTPAEATATPVIPTATPAEATATPIVPTTTPAEATPTPVAPTPTPTPVVKTTAASRLLERANTLLAQLAACTNNAEKRALLGASNNSLGNDAIRTKLLADLGGSWEQLEEEVVDATEYQQDKTLYVQVYIAGKSANYEAVVYTTQNSDRSGNQWATNLVYDDETETWMEYTQKHAYNSSRVGYYMTGLYNNVGAWDALKDTMETSDVWQPVEVPAVEEAASNDETQVVEEAPVAEETPAADTLG
jgi:hypothetical protein